MKVFVTASSKGDANRAEIEELCGLVSESGFEAFCFNRDVERYRHVFDDPKVLMQRIHQEILACDALLIDMTLGPTGRAIEAGMAYACGKVVMTIMKRGTRLKDPGRGISQIVVEYDRLGDIVEPLRAYRAKHV